MCLQLLTDTSTRQAQNTLSSITVMLAAISFAVSGNIAELIAEQMSQGAFVTLLVVGLIANILYTAVHCFLSYKLFNKGVNVD